MQWYQIKECAAGNLRLKLSWLVYKVFGRYGLNLIVFFVTLVSFICSKNIRNYSKKYLEIMSSQINISSSLLNQFKHCLSFALSLGDKLEIYSDSFKFSNIYFEDENIKTEIYKDIDKMNGVFFLCSHIGSIDVLRMLARTRTNVEVNIIISKSQSQIFNNFLKTITKITPMNTFCVDDFGIETSILLKDSLEKGNIVFIAGDRISEHKNSASFSTKFLGKDVKFPLGSFKLAQLMEVPIYFISAIKEKNSKYKIIAQKHNYSDLKTLQADYVKYLEELVKKYPFQYYQFYDFF